MVSEDTSWSSFLLNPIHHVINLGGRNISFFTGPDDTVPDFCPVKKLPAPVFLNNPDLVLFHGLIGRKPAAAGKALPAAADRRTVIGIPGICDLCIRTVAVRAFHMAAPLEEKATLQLRCGLLYRMETLIFRLQGFLVFLAQLSVR